jgi:hypothetical protein
MSTVALVALLASAGLAALSFTRPASVAGTQQDLYTQGGTFSYDATAPAGKPVYGGTSVSTGQPIFLRLVQHANFHFTYRFETKASHSISGRVGLVASLSAPDGWKRTLPLSATRSFSGDAVTVTGSLDLRELNALLGKVGELSNVTAGTYTLTLQPQVSVHGAIAGDAVNDSFTPKLGFMLDSYQLQLQPSSATGTSSTSLLSQSASGSGPVTVANTVSLLKLKLPVTESRRIAVFGGVAALALLLAGLALARRRRPRSEREGIEQRFGELIVRVTATPRGLDLPTVSLGSIDGLVQIAEQLGRVILHLENEEADVYFVEDNGFVYTYEPQAAEVAEAGPALHRAEASPQS